MLRRYVMLRSIAVPAKPNNAPLDTTPSSSSPQARQQATSNETVVQQYEALLRKILPLQKDNLDGFLSALQQERERLDTISREFDQKLKQMEKVRDDIRVMLKESERRSLDRRDEIVRSLQEQKRQR